MREKNLSVANREHIKGLQEWRRKKCAVKMREEMQSGEQRRESWLRRRVREREGMTRWEKREQ